MLAISGRRLRDRRAHFCESQLEHVLERADDELVLPGKMMQLRAARHSRAAGYFGGRGAGVSALEQARHGGVEQPPPGFRTSLFL